MDARPTAPPPATAAPASSAIPAWAPGPTGPALAGGDVHVWRVELANVEPALVELLDAEERERAARLASPRDRATWPRARGVLRALLAAYLDAEPQALRFALGPHGKPRLAGEQLCFNLSHSGELALYAITRAGPVGVDVELAQPRGSARERDVDAIARRAFGDDVARSLASLAPPLRERELLRLWTRHEAELKRRGTGIGGRSPRRDTAPWLAELDVGPRGAAALACSSPPHELRCWDWPPAARDRVR